ncbi:hypothetical protein EB155_05060 [archaeon]|nr:hypothetical protein [archaeon]NDB55384.1 hypothetical protein [archaeon]NDB79216.1 hypothetical protein [archaeon]
MPRKPKTPKNKMYFTLETEEAIIAYNKSESLRERNQLYVEKIKYPFEKIAENVLNTYKFSYFDDGPSDVKREVVSQMISKIHMFQEGKGKAFSYFTRMALNHLILLNNSNYKRYKQNDLISAMPESWNPAEDTVALETDSNHIEFRTMMLEYWDKKLNSVFDKKRDIQIADAILELFRRVDYIENFNKKSLYLLIREMTGHKTHYITKVISIMKVHQDKILEEFLNTGDIEIEEDTFF